MLTRMKSPKALIWSCCISVLPPSSYSSLLWMVFCLSSAPLLLCVWFSPFFSLWTLMGVVLLFFLTTWCLSCLFITSHTLYVMLPHLPLGILARSPTSTSSFCISSLQKCCFFLLLLVMLIWLPDILIMSWSLTYTVQWSSWKVMHNFNK